VFTKHPHHISILMLIFLLALVGCSTEPAPVAEIINSPVPVATKLAKLGHGDTLHMLYAEPPTTLNPHLALAQSDLEVARLTYEPLATYDNDGNLLPVLAAKIPSLDNGQVAPDGMSVTWSLRNDVVWSDGKPFTADDVKFTFDYVSNPAVKVASATTYDTVAGVEVVDRYTVKVNFKGPNPAWAIPFVGLRGLILPQHVFAEYNNANAEQAPANIEPVGTGPYRVLPPGIKPQEILFLGTQLVQTNKIVFEPNPYSRFKHDIYFSKIEVRGGGTDNEAARLSLETGAVDIAWNLNLPVEELTKLQTNGKGKLLTSFGATVEQIELNHTNPNKFTTDGENSSLQFPHPFFNDLKVRQAIAYAIDRDAIVKLYGSVGKPASHVLMSPPQYVSDKVFYKYNLNQAAALLTDDGWADSDGDGIRNKGGQKLSIRFQTAANPIRQEVQRIIKNSLEKIGVEVEVKIIDNSIFLGTDVNNLNNVQRFSADMQAFPWNSLSPDPGIFLQFWTCAQVAQKANNWSGFNSSRFCSADYDKLYEQSRIELNPEKRREILMKMNDMLTEDVVLLPLVDQARVSGVNPHITGFAPTPWDALTWNIKDWRLNP